MKQIYRITWQRDVTVTRTSNYYERLNFILQENINKRGMGGNWWLADTCNEGIVCMGWGLVFV